MLLFATSLVGLAAMANAQYVSADETKMPPVGYTSGEIELSDGETGKFSFDNLYAYTNTQFPQWGGTWSRMMAVHISKGNSGATATGSLQMTYTDNSGSIVQHTSGTQMVLAGLSSHQWWCGRLDNGGAGLNVDVGQKLEVSFTADCSTNTEWACPLKAGFTATAFFYNIATTWANQMQYSDSEAWNDKACFGSTNPVWANDGTDRNSGNFGAEAIFRPADNEGFTANLETVTFNNWKLASVPSEIQVYTSQDVTTGNAFPGLTVYVGREVAGSSLGLYSKMSMALTSATKVMYCMQTVAAYDASGGSIWQFNGNQEYVNPASDYSAWCNIGCFPNSDCTSASVPFGSWEMEDVDVNMVNGQFQQIDGLYVHALIVGVEGTASAGAAVPDLKAAFAFGHLPDAATAFGPSALLGFLALAAATLA